MRNSFYASAVGFVLLLTTAGAAQAATDGEGDTVAASYPGELVVATAPLIDVERNPGCGVKMASRQERIERNRRMALYYFEASVETARRDYKYTLARQGCVPNDQPSKWLYGAFTPPPSNPFVVAASGAKGSEEKLIQRENKAWRTVFPDLGATPGTLRIIPYDGGVYFSLLYSGHSKKGEAVAFWEVVNMLVDDNGKIYHYECWNDTAGMDRAFQIAFGETFLGLSLQRYHELIEERLKAAKAEGS